MNWSVLPSRILLALKLEWLTLWTPGCGLSYILNKWASVLRNKSSMVFLGQPFLFEDRLAPFLMFTYVNETKKCLSLCDQKSKALRVLEIGGNIGNWGVCWLHQAPQTELFTFEPNPKPFKILESNSKGFTSWKIFNFGVGSQDSARPLYFVEGKSGQGSIFSENANKNLLSAGEVTSADVQLRRLDPAFCERNLGGRAFDFVKIDVEGAEWEVLEGISVIEWKSMYVELNLRDGLSTIEQFLEVCRQKWPDVELVESKPYENGNCDLFLKRKTLT